MYLKRGNLQMPGKDAIVAVIGKSPFPRRLKVVSQAELSVAGDDSLFARGAAARRDATGMASKPDGAPIAELVPIVGVGMPFLLRASSRHITCPSNARNKFHHKILLPSVALKQIAVPQWQQILLL